MSAIKIPNTVKEVTDELDMLGKLATATEWKRAALVASVVRLDNPAGRPPSGVNRAGLRDYTPGAFAALGIHGLRSANTVRLYVQRWLDASNDKYPKLGKAVTLPNIDWPPHDGSEGSRLSMNPDRAIDQFIEKHGVEAIAAAVSRPEIAQAVAERDESFGAVLNNRVERDARWERDQRDSGVGGGRGGGSIVSPVLDAMQKLKMQMGTIVYVGGGKQMYEAILARSKESQPWRPGEIETLIEEINTGLRYGADSKALLTPVSDEDLANLLAGGTGEQH